MSHPAGIGLTSLPLAEFLCTFDANVYQLEFLSFVIRDYETKRKIFEVAKDMELPADITFDPNDINASRRIKYTFDTDVLRSPSISTKYVATPLLNQCALSYRVHDLL